MRRSQNGHVQVLTLLHVAWRLLPIEDGADYIARFAQDAFGRHRFRIQQFTSDSALRWPSHTGVLMSIGLLAHSVDWRQVSDATDRLVGARAKIK